ncbi:MAG: lantibiotic dehydratase family protein, partial [bacterium]|nr:lantibiotic dehydratase family protein [bacterium]
MYSLFDDPLIVGRVPLLSLALAQRVFSASEPLGELARVFREHPIALTALHVASPSLHEAALEWLDGKPLKNKHTPIRLLAYFLRMAARPTPFGLCASVGELSCGPQTTLTLGGLESLRTRTRIDMGWLCALIRSIEDDAVLRPHLTLFESDAVLERGERLHVLSPVSSRSLCQCRACRRRRGAQTLPMSIRNTPVVSSIRERCRNGITVERLIRALSDDLELSQERAVALIDELWNSGLLVSSLQPPPIGDPLAHLLRELSKLPLETALALEGIRAQIRALDATPVPQRGAGEYRAVERALEAVHSGPGPTLLIDLAHGFEGALGREVAAEVERFALIQLRFSQTSTLKGYRERFMARYEGSERLVPLLELVDPNSGLGAPDEVQRIDGQATSYRTRLLALASRAARDGSLEVALSEAELAACLPAMPPLRALPPSIEVGFQVAASSAEAVRAGDFTVCVSGLRGTVLAGRSVARFADLLGSAATARIRRHLQREQDAGEPLVEVIYRPAKPHTLNLTLHPPLTAYEIRAGFANVAGETRLLPLSDLLVGLEEGRFYLYSRHLGRRVRP